MAPTLAHLWRTKRGGNGASNGSKQSLRHRPSETLSERIRASVRPPLRSRKQQRMTYSNQSEPVFWRGGEGKVLLRGVHHRVAQSDTEFLFLFDNRYT